MSSNESTTFEFNKFEIEKILSTYPDKIAVAKEELERALLEVKRISSFRYLQLQAENAEKRISSTDLKYMVNSSDDVYKAELERIVKESNYLKLYETLMCVKKIASLREAF
jgi:hypothetical protein